MSIKQGLIKARARIQNPDHWTQEYLARNAQGEATNACSSEACCWCALGATEWAAEVMGMSESGLIAQLRDTLRTLVPDPHPYIGDFNDSRTHFEVLKLFDMAIENAQS